MGHFDFYWTLRLLYRTLQVLYWTLRLLYRTLQVLYWTLRLLYRTLRKGITDTSTFISTLQKGITGTSTFISTLRKGITGTSTFIPETSPHWTLLRPPHIKKVVGGFSPFFSKKGRSLSTTKSPGNKIIFTFETSMKHIYLPVLGMLFIFSLYLDLWAFSRKIPVISLFILISLFHYLWLVFILDFVGKFWTYSYSKMKLFDHFEWLQERILENFFQICCCLDDFLGI